MLSKKHLYLVLVLLILIIIQISCVISTQSKTPPPTEDPKQLLIQIHATQTALAQLSKPNSLSTLAPTETTATTKIPAIDRGLYFLEQVGGKGLITAIAMLLIGILIARFNDILNLLGKFSRWVWALISRQTKDYAFEREYLDWIIGQNRHLGLLPAQVVARRWGDRQQFVNLEDIYVRLSLSSQIGDESWAISKTKDEFRYRKLPGYALRIRRSIASFLLLFIESFSLYFENLKSLSFRLDRIRNSWYALDVIYSPGSLGQVVDRNKRLVLRGDPGSGKTTLMRYLAVTSARALRNDKRDGDSTVIVRNRLSWTEKPFPILIRLSRYGNVTNWSNQYSLIDAFRDEMPVELRKRCPSDFFEKRLKERPCLILLDAFDELGTSAARAAMAQQINGFLEVYETPKQRIVVTTRVIGYEGQLNRYGFHIRTVQPLQDGEIRALIKQRYNAFTIAETAGRNKPDAHSIQLKLAQRSQALIEKIESTPSLRQLAVNPMLLSLIVLVHFLKVELPDERVLLYRDCVEILTERWLQFKREESGDMIISSSELDLAQKLFLLREIAFEMQKRRSSDIGQAVIRREEAKKIISMRLPELVSENTHQDAPARKSEYLKKADELISGIQSTSGILVEQGLDEDGEPLISFSHLTFQEYMAAVALQESVEYREVLFANLLNPAWQEVILLYVKISNDATSVVKALQTSTAQIQGSLIAGRCLTQKIRIQDNGIYDEVSKTLIDIFYGSDNIDLIHEAEIILAELNRAEILSILQQEITGGMANRQVNAIRSITHLKPNTPFLYNLTLVSPKDGVEP